MDVSQTNILTLGRGSQITKFEFMLFKDFRDEFNDRFSLLSLPFKDSNSEILSFSLWFLLK